MRVKVERVELTFLSERRLNEALRKGDTPLYIGGLHLWRDLLPEVSSFIS